MARVFHQTFFLQGPSGRLEAVLWTAPRPSPALAAIVCHPHPLYGGTMHNKVVSQIAKTLHRFGIPILRFNFRGAGMSEGAHDNGRGERDDVRAALDHLGREFPGLPILLAGFSFGAWVGLHVGCEDARVAELVGLGLPVNSASLDYLRECTKPKLFIQGSNDEFGARAQVQALFAELPGPKRLIFVEGADHFFAEKLNAADAALLAWLAERHS